MNFTVLDVLALGSVVRETSKSFDDYWNSKWAVPIEAFVASLHAKAIVVDRRFVVVGSINRDPRSRLHNTEVAMLIESAELGAQVAELFEGGVHPADAFRVELAERDRPEAGLVWLAEEDGKPVRYTSEPASFWKRFAAGLLSLFAPEHML